MAIDEKARDAALRAWDDHWATHDGPTENMRHDAMTKALEAAKIPERLVATFNTCPSCSEMSPTTAGSEQPVELLSLDSPMFNAMFKATREELFKGDWYRALDKISCDTPLDHRRHDEGAASSTNVTVLNIMSACRDIMRSYLSTPKRESVSQDKPVCIDCNEEPVQNKGERCVPCHFDKMS